MSLLSTMVLIHVIGAIVGFITIVVLNVQEASYHQKILSLTSISSFIGLIAYLFELLSNSKEAALLAVKFGYVGKSYAMVLFLIFITKYCDFYLPSIVKKGLLVFSTFNLVIVLTNSLHMQYYTSVDYVADSAIPHISLGKGAAYYFVMAVILFVMITYMVVTFSTMLKRKGKEKIRLLLLCFACVIPAIALLLNLFKVIEGFDPTPLGIMCSCIIVSYTVLRYGLLDAVQIAKEDVIDSVKEGVLVVGKSYNYLYSNNKANEIFPELAIDGVRKEVIGKLFEDVNEGNLEKRTFEKNDTIYELRYSILSSNNNEDAESITGYLLWIFDKTTDYKYTKELERLRMEAEYANKEKTAFLAKMSHEIRTPMNGIMGFADLSLQNKLDVETREYVEYIKNSADSLLGIINDVLDISKIESGKMEIVDVEYNPIKMFRDIAVIIESQAEAKNLIFKLVMEDEVPVVLHGDSTRFREILINVLGNAVKYTQKGSVTFSIGIKEQNDDEIVFDIHVKDTGVGIKEDKLDSIFNTFEQADNIANYRIEGTGLGLSIARQLAELMGGSLTVNSVFGKGSDFCLILPQKKSKATLETAKTVEENCNYEIETYGAKALVVDDNEINLKVEKGLLEKYGIEVDCADSGELCIAKTDLEKYDVIFMDHMMPGMDGVETFHRIRKQSVHNLTTPVLIVTANAIMEIRKKLLKEGFDGYISKPIDIMLLESELLKVLPSEKINIKMKNDSAEAKLVNQFFENRDLRIGLSKAGVDMETGIKYCGDIEYYKEILQVTVDGYEEKYATIKKYCDTEDYNNLIIIVHSLKSNANNIGAVELGQLAKEVEEAGKTKKVELIKNKTEQMLNMYTEVAETIRELLEYHQNEDADVEVETGKFEEGMWDEYMYRLKFLLDELEAEAAYKLVDELHGTDVSEKAKILLHEMKLALDKYDIEAAKVRLNSLMSTEI